MFADAHDLKGAGADVVCGYVETHGRARTEGMIGDPEVVPRGRVVYKGIIPEELDAQAVITRVPQIALVDELAHANVPGSKNRKRYQDVEEILGAGINIVSTLNIQHLESINEFVEIYVETPREAPERISATTQRHLAENLLFARELGAEVVMLKGTDVVAELARFARENNVTYVVMGHTERTRLQEFLRGSVINRLVRELGDVDVQVVP